MVYDMLAEPPAPGTPMESLMMMVWRMRQDVELNKTRAIIQALIAAASEGEEGNKNMHAAWADYMEELFPFKRGVKKSADQAAIDFLKREVAKGPLRVTPLQPIGRAQSRMKTRQAEVEAMKLRRPKGRRR